MKAMLLAAGSGERLKPLTDKTPKPLFEVGGTSLIERHIGMLRKADITDLVINVRHLGHQIIEKLGSGEQLGVDITWSEESEKLETGGGIKNALVHLGTDPFLVVSTDTYHEMDYANLVKPLPQGSLGRLVMVDNPDHHPEGDFAIDETGALQSVGDRLTYTGSGVLSPGLVSHVTDTAFPLRTVFDEAIDAGLLCGVRYDGYWCDVGTLDRYRELLAYTGEL